MYSKDMFCFCARFRNFFFFVEVSNYIHMNNEIEQLIVYILLFLRFMEPSFDLSLKETYLYGPLHGHFSPTFLSPLCIF